MKSMEKTQKLPTINQVASSARKGIKRRRREFEKIHIPNDIVEDIMIRLPVKSLMRFQAVSKHWRSLITSKDFRERYMDLGQSKECKLLIVSDYVKDYAAREANFSLKTVALGTTPASVVDETALKFEIGTWKLYISQSCDGLVCLYDINIAVKVVNPATKMYIELPLSRIQQICMNKHDPDSSVQDPHHVKYPGLSFSQFGFGKDNVTGKYKLVWLYNTFPFFTTTCEVLDLEVKKWRFVDTNSLDHHNIMNNNLSNDQGPVFANGSLYWLTADEDGDPMRNTKIIVFNIHTEIFQVIPMPPFITRDASGDCWSKLELA
ncbi:PREDICTED: putative F-box protein At2g02030 [Camelina sativa]|uniref:F-box protein At2g02030 n=1 Tax=Camelina sativa TaxID=90675 RepID=A0ABM0Y5T6_CAMSA|nr:PREDICTED: putative F-box protein At2g02030 [Camelina sativa]